MIFRGPSSRQPYCHPVMLWFCDMSLVCPCLLTFVCDTCLVVHHKVV